MQINDMLEAQGYGGAAEGLLVDPDDLEGMLGDYIDDSDYLAGYGEGLDDEVLIDFSDQAYLSTPIAGEAYGYDPVVTRVNQPYLPPGYNSAEELGSMTDFNGVVGEGAYGTYLPPGYASPEDLGSMTNFNGIAGEGYYTPLGEGPPFVAGGYAEIGEEGGIEENEGEGNEVVAYCVGTFVVFSLAYALIRRQCNK